MGEIDKTSQPGGRSPKVTAVDNGDGQHTTTVDSTSETSPCMLEGVRGKGIITIIITLMIMHSSVHTCTSKHVKGGVHAPAMQPANHTTGMQVQVGIEDHPLLSTKTRQPDSQINPSQDIKSPRK
jgi:hypothetical protein